MNMFKTLLEKGLLVDYVEFFDWLLSDDKFDKGLWDNKNKVQAFTKAIHRVDSFSADRIIYGAKRDIAFPSFGDYKKISCPAIYMSKGESEARDLIRHIRNSIAHGNVKLHDGSSLIIELMDYGKEGYNNSGQTAYMCFTLDSLLTIYKVYREKEMNWKKKKANLKK